MSRSGKQLRHYQIEGISFIRSHKRAILADDVGLGKTVEALGGIQFPCLIISPKRAFNIWLDEINEWLPSVLDEQIVVYHGTIKQREQIAFNVVKYQPKIVISTYAMMGEIQEKISVRWKVIIFDEAHILRNRKATTLYKKAKLFSSDRLYLVTGSPVVNGAQDYWTLLNLLDKKNFRSYWRFVNKYCIVDDSSGMNQILGTNPLNAMELNQILNSYMIKRRAKDVLEDLPDFARQFVTLEMTPRQKQVYNELAYSFMTKLEDGQILITPNTLSLFTRLRQLLVSPKLLGINDDGIAIQSLRDELEELQENTVIFTPFREAIPYIVNSLESIGYTCYTIAGGMDENRIEFNRQEFLKHDRKAALISTLQMGTSWSVAGIRICYTLGFEWIPMFHEQSEGRLAGGLRRKQSVLSKYFIHENTIDMHMRQVLGNKVTWIQLATNPVEFFMPKKRQDE